MATARGVQRAEGRVAKSIFLLYNIIDGNTHHEPIRTATRAPCCVGSQCEMLYNARSLHWFDVFSTEKRGHALSPPLRHPPRLHSLRPRTDAVIRDRGTLPATTPHSVNGEDTAQRRRGRVLFLLQNRPPHHRVHRNIILIRHIPTLLGFPELLSFFGFLGLFIFSLTPHPTPTINPHSVPPPRHSRRRHVPHAHERLPP